MNAEQGLIPVRLRDVPVVTETEKSSVRTADVSMEWNVVRSVEEPAIVDAENRCLKHAE